MLYKDVHVHNFISEVERNLKTIPLLCCKLAMEQHPLSFKWLLFIFLICSTYVITASATHSFMIPRLSLVSRWETTLHDRRALLANYSEDIKTFYYKQTLDHFNYRPQSYQTFQQRYLINFKYWGGANSSAPIFAYLGAEAPIDSSPAGIGFLTDNAASFNALIVYIEVLQRTAFFYITVMLYSQ